MEILMQILGNKNFIDFLSTFGLAVLLVAYFVFIRDPKINKYWQDRYDKLLESYNDLSENYKGLKSRAEEIWDKQRQTLNQRYHELTENLNNLGRTYSRLESDLRPESRVLSDDQAIKLSSIGMDRDLYKLYYYLCEKLEHRRVEDIGFFLEDTILDTNESWGKFTSPFPKVPRITDLYGVYKNKGGSLKIELEKILNGDEPDEEKKVLIWQKLVNNTVKMKREFNEFINTLNQGGEVDEYMEPESETEDDIESQSNSLEEEHKDS